MTGYRVLAQNTIANLAGRLGAIALSLLVSTVLFRTMGASRYGLWSLLVSIAGYSMLLDFGLATAIERRVAAQWVVGDGAGVARTLTSSITGVGVVLAVVQVLVLAGVSWPGVELSRDVFQGLAVLPACTAMTAAGLVMGAGLSGLQRMADLHVWRLLGFVVGAVAVLGAARAGVARLDVLLPLYCCGGLVAAAFQWRSVRKRTAAPRFRFCWDGPTFRELLSFGSVLQLATTVPPLAEYAFRMIVGARFGLEYAGIYDLAARAAIVLRSLAGALFAAMVPFGVQTLALRGAEGAGRLVRLAVKYSALFVLPGTAVLLALSDDLMRIWLGGAPERPLVLAGFQAILLAHAVGAIGAPIAMLGRVHSRPVAEAAFTIGSFALSVLAAKFAPTWLWAFAAFWAFPALAGLLLWGFIGRVVGIRFESGRDLLLTSLLAAATWGVARAAQSALGGADWAHGIVGVAIVGVVCAAVAGAGALLLRLLDVRKLAGLRRG